MVGIQVKAGMRPYTITTTALNIPAGGVCLPDLDLRAEQENDPVAGYALNTVPMVLLMPMAMSC